MAPQALTPLNTFRAVVLAFRPKTLSAAIIPVLCGAGLFYLHSQTIHWSLLGYILLSALCIQIGTNLINDAIDFKKGADTETRIGPKRITQMQVLSPQKVQALGLMFFAMAAVFGIPLVIKGGVVIVAIGILSLICGYAYTGGPYPLAYVGLGDLFVVLFFGLIAVGGTYFLFADQFHVECLILGFQVGLLSTTLIAINNLRDSAQDELVDKKTLAVRFGERFSKMEIAFCLLVPFLLNGYWIAKGLWWLGLLPLIVLPLSLKLVAKIYRTAPSMAYNAYLAQSSAIFILFGVLTCVGFLLS